MDRRPAEWQLQPNGPRHAGSFSVVDEKWSAQIEEIILTGLKLFAVSAEIRAPMEIEVKGGTPGAALHMSSFLEAPVEMVTPDSRFDLSHGQTVIYRIPGQQARFLLQPAPVFRHVGVSYAGDMLADVVDGPAYAQLKPYLVSDPERTMLRELLPPTSLAMLRWLVFAAPLTGSLRRLALEGAARAVLAELLYALGVTESSLALTAQEEKVMREARAALLADLRNPPGLTDLAATLGISQRRLASGFRQLYGATALEIVRDARLDQAYAILSRSDVAVKELAWRVGYAHASTFVAAFTRRFGEPPGRLTRSGRVK